MRTTTYEFIVKQESGDVIKVVASGKNIRAALKSASVEWDNVVTYKYL